MISKGLFVISSSQFSEQSLITLPGVDYNSVAWGDYDNDGYLDILLAGINPEEQQLRVAKVYRNNGNNTFTEEASLPGVSFGSVAWGDYDNDGYLDILLTGQNDTDTVSKIYHNNHDNTFAVNSSISLIGINKGSGTWADYDNDGNLDFLLNGYSSNGPISKIYRNNGDNTFKEKSLINLTGVQSGSTTWGDYDNDGDLDILLTGDTKNGYVSKIYRNNNTTSNSLPSVPSNLKSLINENTVTFGWDKSTDNETPQDGLTYNLAIGTSPGSCDILSPMSDRSTGYRRIVSMGNAGHCNSWTKKGCQQGNITGAYRQWTMLLQDQILQQHRVL